MQFIARTSGRLFGILMLTLSVVIAIETVIRKLFSISLGGVDELSGYAIAIGAPLAFTVALVNRSHIRINIFLMRTSVKLQAWASSSTGRFAHGAEAHLTAAALPRSAGVEVDDDVTL